MTAPPPSAPKPSTLSYRQNYLDLDPTYTDKYGDPLIRLTLDWTDHERAQGAMLTGVHKQWPGP